MSWSLGEIAILSTRAARGAGQPWGVAEEAGRAVRWLAATGLPGLEALARWIEGGPGECPITLGLAISDSGDAGKLATAGAVSEPLLLLPFLARAVPQGSALVLATAAGDVALWRDGTDLAGDLPSGTDVAVSGETRRPVARPLLTRVEAIDADALEALRMSASLIFAPATEESRLLGAGAGEIDND